MYAAHSPKNKKNHTACYCWLSVVTSIAFYSIFTEKPAAEHIDVNSIFCCREKKHNILFFQEERTWKCKWPNLLFHSWGQFQKICFKPSQTPTQNPVLLLNCSRGVSVSVCGRVCPISYRKGNLADIKGRTVWVQRGDRYLITNHSNPHIYHDTGLKKWNYIVIHHGNSMLKPSLSPDNDTDIGQFCKTPDYVQWCFLNYCLLQYLCNYVMVMVRVRLCLRQIMVKVSLAWKANI